jgi:hypothetical protein
MALPRHSAGARGSQAQFHVANAAGSPDISVVFPLLRDVRVASVPEISEI